MATKTLRQQSIGAHVTDRPVAGPLPVFRVNVTAINRDDDGSRETRRDDESRRRHLSAAASNPELAHTVPNNLHADIEQNKGVGAFVDIDELVIGAAMIGRADAAFVHASGRVARDPPFPSDNRLHDATIPRSACSIQKRSSKPLDRFSNASHRKRDWNPQYQNADRN